ncbi:MAG: N-acetyltransferase [Ruminococcus sp.]|nr:N-acetyltransferase [Ruminococcus sp.]
MEKGLIIREAEIDDAERLREIYSYYVTETAVSFEYDVPSVKEFENRIKATKEKYPYFVCEKNGEVVGYTYAGAYSTRSAYSWTVASSIYVEKDHRRQGIGSALYEVLEKELVKKGIVNILAGAAFCEKEDEYLTHGSYEFHRKMGYKKVAQLIKVGKKFDRWYDLIWMQKMI